MQVNWKALKMQYKFGGVIVTMQGDPSFRKSLVSLKAMMRAFKEHGKGCFINWAICTLKWAAGS